MIDQQTGPALGSAHLPEKVLSTASSLHDASVSAPPEPTLALLPLKRAPRTIKRPTQDVAYTAPPLSKLHTRHHT